MSGVRRTKTTLTIPLPNIPLPRRTAVPRNPKGWGTTRISLRARGLAGLGSTFHQPEPAGDPDPAWQAQYPAGTRPEWAVYWALSKPLHMIPGLDFYYQARLPGVGASYYSTVDFLIPDFNTGIEVQGKFWHYGQGSQKIFKDVFRVQAFAGQGIKVIFIDEPDALSNPTYFTEEALRGVDHSHVTSGRKNF
jgi:hypothetical protein